MTRFKHLFTIKGYSLFILCMLFLGIGISITTPYLSLYCTKEMGMSAGTFGVFMAISSLSGVFVNSFIAKRSDNGLNRKWIIIIAMLASSIGYISYLWFHNYFILLVMVTFFSGIGAPAMPQIFAYAQESANESSADDKVFAVSTLRSLFSLGFLIGPLGGTLILAANGYKGLFIWTALIFLGIALLVLVFLQKKKTTKSPKKKVQTDSSVWKNKKLRRPFMAFILLFTVSTINAINTPLFVVNILHGTHTDVGLIVGISAGLEIPIMIFLGAISKKVSTHTLMIYGCFIAMLYYIALNFSHHAWEVLIAQLLQATYIAIIMGNGLTYFNDLLPNSPGISSTLYSNDSTIGKLVGNLGGGVVAQFIGFRHVYWVCLLVLFVSFLILWQKNNDTERSHQDE